NPDVVLNADTTSYLIDMDNDGVFDFKFSYQALNTFSIGLILPYSENEVLGTWFNSYFIAALDANETIASSLPLGDNWELNEREMFGSTCTYYSSAEVCYETGPWLNPMDKFAGVILHLADGDHYGWIRMTH